MFIGRKDELIEIRSAINSNKFESILVYGRRRVGKSELIMESLKNINKPVIHFECKKTTNALNLEMLSNVVLNTFDMPISQFKDFDSFFSFLFKESTKREFIFILDEFSFLLDNDFSIESSIAIAIDKYKNESKMKLIISGSYITLMTKMIEYGSHSYGRFNHILLIRPFDYYESSLFYSDYSNEDKIKMYSIFGGIPYFNSLIDTKKTADENIIELIVKRDSILEHEISEMILMETSKISALNELVNIIGSGINKYKDIVSILNQSKSNRPDYLINKLVEMDIISKTTPINDKNNPKKMFYSFEDNLIHFYYKYIFNNPYSINRKNPEFFYNEFIKDDLEKQYIPKKFEKISKEFLLRANFKRLVKNTIMDIGTFTYDDPKNKINREFDCVTKDSNGFIAYECKYTNNPIDNTVILEEEKQTKNLKNICFYKLGFISKKGFKETIDKDKYICFTLDDFYK